MPKPRDVVQAKLEALNASLLESIDQRVSMRLAAQELDNVDGEGICTGYCLEWARKVLLRNRLKLLPKNIANIKTDEEVMRKLKDKAMRMATAQRAFAKGVAGTNAPRMAERQTRHAAISGKAKSLMEADGKVVDLANGLPNVRGATGPLPPGIFKQLQLEGLAIGQSNSFSYEALAELHKALEAKIGLYSEALPKLHVKTSDATAWSNVASALDKWVAQRTREKNFSGLQLVSPTSQKLSFSKSAAQWIDTIVKGPPELAVREMCAFLTFEHKTRVGNGPQKNGRHTVAITRLRDDLYAFLDPNYGTFTADGAALRRSFDYLLKEAYFTDGQEWCEDGTYNIFKRNET